MLRNVIEIKYLKTFSCVAKCKSFSAAAESLFITQPAVSQHIKKVEAHIGASIFDREEGFELTKEGEILLRYTELSLDLYEQLFDELGKAKNKERYKIAVSDSFSTELVDEVVKAFRVLSHLDLSLVNFRNPKDIDASKFDIILGVNSEPSRSGHMVNVKRTQYVVCDRPNDPPLTRKNPIRVVHCNSLEREQVITLLEETGFGVENIQSWFNTSSARLMKSEMEEPGTVLVCPSWCIKSDRLYAHKTSNAINCYAWCNESTFNELSQIGLTNRIKELFVHTDSALEVM
ncbi:transcriptional regulator [Vibrio nigripulchritudo ATCC 27043]|uniref:LysR family Transcriptional regulator n=1 Tax=Vibrio nigripulchritudo SOn1 TaxID=1238450 RepID=A0AAV2VVY2_9VIBR|nr:LysR family transcriptional regulator [Vibrio nigripulchritudo]EGU60898.1 transcriptional regulator [Vibrio nigripulchritudo ATCC 27043]CCN71189.1 putative LysR family Transcriptional regulator [Vibrio nigripulchritudo SFn118]CCO48610.1 putative LysR family Transcriptional regulator [Vibrio nigripulchritudo SOn1]BCL69513.1 LysR family transcriptional regulator [Vibrio nigripulchritudo]BDU30853.1 LysR family transcriptional regulator [Vibrio nigripulchritudo]